jgi:putative hemolysin
MPEDLPEDLRRGAQRPRLSVAARAPAAARPFWPWLAPLLDRLLGLDRLDRSYRRVPAGTEPRRFPAAALAAHDIGWRASGRYPGAVPRTGPLVVVANHPTGAAEGLALFAALLAIRGDVRSISNRMLAAIPEMRPLIFQVDARARGPANLAELRAIRRHLAGGGAILAFPAGTVAHFRWRRLRVAEAPWHPIATRLAASTGATICPVRVAGAAGPGFHLAAALSRRARTWLLPRVLADQRGRRLELAFEAPLRPGEVAGHEPDALMRRLEARLAP